MIKKETSVAIIFYLLYNKNVVILLC